jgi:hypothetical protein
MSYYIHGETLPAKTPWKCCIPHKSVETALAEARARSSFGAATVWIVDDDGKVVMGAEEVSKALKGGAKALEPSRLF